MRSPRRVFCVAVAVIIAFLGVMLARSHSREQAVSTLRLDPVVVTSQVSARDAAAPVPTRPNRFPLEYLTAFALVGATKTTRRKSGAKRSDVPLYLDSDVHVPLEDSELKEWRSNAPPGQPGHGGAPIRLIKGGVLVDDTDLTDEQIEDLQTRGVIRPATMKEVQASEARAKADERRELEQQQKTEIQQLQAKQEQARAEATSKNANADQIAKLNERQTAELTALQDKHVKALNAFDKKGE